MNELLAFVMPNEMSKAVVGQWLLLLPCFWGLGLALLGGDQGVTSLEWLYYLLFACATVYNFGLINVGIGQFGIRQAWKLQGLYFPDPKQRCHW